MNEHDEVRELLELAAVEPGGLDRLEAGDAPEAALAVGHLAGCPDCLEEMARLRRAEALLRPILATEPDPALRERTLAFVRAVGVRRGAEAAGTANAPDAGLAAEPAAAGPAPVPAPGPGPVAASAPAVAGSRSRRPTTPAWAGLLAAALVIGLVGGALVARSNPGGGDSAVAALQAVAKESTTLYAADDLRKVALVDASGQPHGSLAFSPAADRMLVIATDLRAPGPGMEYRCWVEVSGTRSTIGTMTWTGEVAWWAGEVAIPADIPPGVVYGVSWVQSGSSDPGTVVLTARL